MTLNQPPARPAICVEIEEAAKRIETRKLQGPATAYTKGWTMTLDGEAFAIIRDAKGTGWETWTTTSEGDLDNKIDANSNLRGVRTGLACDLCWNINR